LYLFASLDPVILNLMVSVTEKTRHFPRPRPKIGTMC